MKIKLKELVPADWSINTAEKGITLWFKSKQSHRGNYNRKSFVFPEEIEIDENFAEAIGLFLGDGDMHNKSKTHLTYCSRDLDIASFVLSFLRKKLLLSVEDLTIFVKHGELYPDINLLATGLNVNSEKVKMKHTERHRYPAIHLQANGIVFRLIFEKIVESFVSSNFLQDEELRRGFLRGLFAAEGCVGISYKEFFINSISFTLARHEVKEVDLLQKALSLEGISFEQSYKKSTIVTVISNWRNYLKCWQIGLFDRCERKKKSFLEVARSSKVYARVTPADLQRLSEKYTQRKLAKIIDSWQGNVCRILGEEIWLSLKQIRTLENLGLTFSIRKLRVGNLTELPYSERIRCLFEGKNP